MRESGRPPAAHRRPSAGPVAAAAVAIGLAGLAAGIGIGIGAATPSATTPPPGGSAVAVATPTPRPTPTPTPTPVPTPASVAVAFVPVTHFRSPRDGTTAAELAALAAGDGAWDELVLAAADADPLLAALGLDRAALGERLVVVSTAAEVAPALASTRKRLGFLRADEVDPSVRALAWDGSALFGVSRTRTLAAWPLVVTLPLEAVPSVSPGPADPSAAPSGGAAPAYDPATAWTLVAGGDILLDRGVSLAIREAASGADFPFDGGTVEITGRCRACSAFGWDLPYVRRTGNAGIVRELLRGADLAIANLENPVPDTFRFHARGTVFSGNPAHLSGLVGAGIDWVSLANNHIGDAGRAGIVATMENLDEAGIAHGGAGADLAEAHAPTILEAGGVRVAFLGYDTIASYYAAGTATPGSARMRRETLRADIAAARAAGAEVVVVFPHWGVEYRATPGSGQRALAKAAIEEGADLVIGNHAHWAGAMEVYRGKPIWYALGNFIFDQTWSEPTMEGITLELTFSGARLVQVRMRPHLILDRAQPNLLDPAGDGRIVMDQIWRASKGLLDW